MSQRFNRNMYPPDGYRFLDGDGTVHRADGWLGLENKVRDYRAINNLPPGNPMLEIEAQLCAQVPGYCADDAPHVVIPPDPSGMSFNQRILAWLAWAAGEKRVNRWSRADDETAARRAAICSTCPVQRSLNHSCEACITSVTSIRKALLDGQEPRHQNLQPCGLLQEDTVSTVQTNALLPSANPALPGHCWRRA